MNSKRLLLCDDDVHILRAAEFKFKRAGFDVHCAADGEQAWQMVLDLRPDLVITDCQMPRLDGLGLATRIKDHPEVAGLPVILLTGKGFELNHAEICAKYGVLMVLAKPFSPRDLLQRVAVVLYSQPTPELALS